MTAPPRRLRVALRAFPRRFRTARDVEITATFREAELAGDEHPYGARALADIVVAGWTERLRTHPPLGQFLKYRLFDGRLDPQWHRWMFDDVRGWFGARRGAWVSAPLIILAVVLRRAGVVYPDEFYVTYLSGLVFFSAILTPTYRRRILRRHGYDPETLTWVPPTSLALTVQRPPRMIRVAPVAFTMAAALGVVAPFAVLASLGRIGAGANHLTRHADGQLPMTIGAVAAAALITVGAIIARRRIARRLTETVDESSEFDLVVSDLTSAGALSAAVMVLGLVACLMPATPLIVPLAFVVVTGAVPTLVVLGTDARRRQRDGALIVWTPRPTRAVKAPPLERRQ
jgi:hypothetical protein